MNKEQIIQRLKDSKEALEVGFFISEIGLFGSYSTDASNKNSDVDLIYQVKKGKRLGFKEIYTLEKFIKDLLEVEKVDLVDQAYVNPIIENEIKKTVIYV